MADTPEWKADLEKSHWTGYYLTGAALRNELDKDYAYLKTTLVELGLAK